MRRLLLLPLLLFPLTAYTQAAGYEVTWSDRDMPAHDYFAAWSQPTFCPPGKVTVAGGWDTGSKGSDANLSQWVGKSEGAHSGSVVTFQPSGNRALALTEVIAAGTPGNHRWLAGTAAAGGIERGILEDDRRWHSYRVTFYPTISGPPPPSLVQPTPPRRSELRHEPVHG